MVSKMPVDIDRIIPILAEEVKSYAVPVVDLMAVRTNDPYKILVTTILSARTRDEVTAQAAARLFKKAPDLDGLAMLSEETIAGLIYPVGFYKTKAGHLARLPSILKTDFDGLIPEDIESLLKLPGVGRKTANLVRTVAFDKPAVCVDTHVHRIMNIWGYVRTRTPLATEHALREKLPLKYWRSFNSILVAFGQGTCRPLAPHCDRCVIEALCPKIGVTPRRPPAGGITAATGIRTFLSWNVNGLRAIEKRGFVDLVKELNPDILGLQEIKAQPDQLSDSLKNIPGYTSFWHPAERKGYAGVCVYARQAPLQVIYGLGIPEYDFEGRVITLEYDDFFFVNIYFPNAGHGLTRLDYKLGFNHHLLAFVNRLAVEKSVIIGGDFNVAHKAIDLKNPQANEGNPGYTPQERAWMDEFIRAGYLDSFRKFNSEAERYTWWSYRFNARARNIGWRIDYFCVDAKSEARIAGAGILDHITGSDHCPVRIDFR